MSKFTLIGLTGLARSGKDEAANVICAEYKFRRASFAGPLKEASAILLDRTLEEVSTGPRDEVLPEYGFTIREFLQKLGTEGIRRVFREDFWVIRSMAAVRRAREEGAPGVVITDVRFDNEAEAIIEQGGIVVEIRRPGLTRMDHASEKGIRYELVAGVIHNDRKLDDFKKSVRDFMYYARN